MFETLPLPPHALDTFQCAQTDAHTFRRLEIWGNGTCFFHSVVCLLTYQNKIVGDAIEYSMAIPSSENIRVKADDPILRTDSKHTASLVFQVKNQHDPEKFYKNAEQVGILLRQFLSQTLTKDRYAQFLKEAFSTDLQWALQGQTPDWTTVKEILQNPSKWADIWVVKYTAWALSLNILFINGSSRQEPVFCGVENFNHGPWTLFVFWSGKVHFEPIVQVVKDRNDGDTQKDTYEEIDIAHRIFPTTHPFILCLRDRFASSQAGGCNMQPHA
jgi:hypothetical protein